MTNSPLIHTITSAILSVRPLWHQIEDPFHNFMLKANIEFGRIKDTYTHVLPFSFAIGYLVMVFLLPKLIKKEGRPGKLLKYTMALWNLFLSVLSLVMTTGLAVGLAEDIQDNGLMGTVCDPDTHLIKKERLLFWTNIFVWSKYFELIDTLLLIIKNPARPVPFLHYYHHATVLLFTWYAIVFEFTVGVWFGVINGFVHTIMYFYYFLTELGYRPSWAVIITVIQISQMVIGIALNIIWAREWLNGAGCTCKAPEIILGSAVVMYGSYLFLFLQFFIKRYFGGSSSSANKKPVVDQKQKSQ